MSARDGLLGLRAVFLAFCGALLMFGVLLPFFIDSDSAADPPTTLLLVGLVLVAAAQVAGSRFETPLDCGDDASLAASYRSRFFRRLAIAEAAALLGFVGCFLVGALWPYGLGLLITATGFVRLAPTTGAMARDQQTLSATGCGRSLVAALRIPPAGSPRT